MLHRVNGCFLLIEPRVWVGQTARIPNVGGRISMQLLRAPRRWALAVHCQDTLDDYFGDWNWKKLITLGTSPLPLDLRRTYPLYRPFHT